MYIQNVITSLSIEGRKEHLMKLGQGLQVFITKYGRLILDKKGSKWDIFVALETAVSKITGTAIEIRHDESSYILYQDNKQIEWVGDGLTPYELHLLSEALQGLIEEKGYKVQLVEA